MKHVFVSILAIFTLCSTAQAKNYLECSVTRLDMVSGHSDFELNKVGAYFVCRGPDDCGAKLNLGTIDGLDFSAEQILEPTNVWMKVVTGKKPDGSEMNSSRANVQTDPGNKWLSGLLAVDTKTASYTLNCATNERP